MKIIEKEKKKEKRRYSILDLIHSQLSLCVFTIFKFICFCIYYIIYFKGICRNDKKRKREKKRFYGFPAFTKTKGE